MVFFSALAELQRKNLLDLGGTSETNEQDLGLHGCAGEKKDLVKACRKLTEVAIGVCRRFRGRGLMCRGRGGGSAELVCSFGKALLV